MLELYINAFSVSLAGCGAKARFLLEAMALRVLLDDGGEMAYSVKTLAKGLHVSEKMVSDALAELVAAGAVCRLSRAKGRGRPSISYQVALAEVNALKARRGAHGLHARFLELLFSGADIATEILGSQIKIRKERAVVTKRGKPAPPGARSRLSASNRLLLGALLAHSDRFGTVAGVSSVELRLVTGLDADSLKHRLRRLVALGLIRSHMPGVSSSVFSGSKVSSMYFLNLNHPGFGAPRNSAVVAHISMWDVKKHNTHANTLWRNVHFERPALGKPQTPRAVTNFLTGQKQTVFNFLEVMLLQYASELLSRHWHELGVDCSTDYGWLRERIAGGLQKPRGEEWQDKAKAHQNEIISFFYGLVLEIAKDYRSSFGQESWIGCNSIGLSILPICSGKNNEIITILVQSPPVEVSECTVLVERKPGVVTREIWKAELDMPLQCRNRYGLVTFSSKRNSWI